VAAWCCPRSSWSKVVLSRAGQLFCILFASLVVGCWHNGHGRYIRHRYCNCVVQVPWDVGHHFLCQKLGTYACQSPTNEGIRYM